MNVLLIIKVKVSSISNDHMGPPNMRTIKPGILNKFGARNPISFQRLSGVGS